LEGDDEERAVTVGGFILLGVLAFWMFIQWANAATARDYLKGALERTEALYREPLEVRRLAWRARVAELAEEGATFRNFPVPITLMCDPIVRPNGLFCEIRIRVPERDSGTPTDIVGAVEVAWAAIDAMPSEAAAARRVAEAVYSRLRGLVVHEFAEEAFLWQGRRVHDPH
jgi:hypothetical protein